MLCHCLVCLCISMVVALHVVGSDLPFFEHFNGSMPFNFGEGDTGSSSGEQVLLEEDPEVTVWLQLQRPSGCSVLEEVVLYTSGFVDHALTVGAYVDGALAG